MFFDVPLTAWERSWVHLCFHVKRQLHKIYENLNDRVFSYVVQSVIFNPWKVLWNWIAFSQNFVLSFGLLYHLIRGDTARIANKAFTSNPMVSSKQDLSDIQVTNWVHLFGSNRVNKQLGMNSLRLHATKWSVKVRNIQNDISNCIAHCNTSRGMDIGTEVPLPP